MFGQLNMTGDRHQPTFNRSHAPRLVAGGNYRAGTCACLVLSLFLAAGCRGKPALRVADVRSATFCASGQTWEASRSEIETLVEAYQRAAIRHDESGTTPPAGADVILRSGEIMRFWGGSEGIQGVWYQGRGVDLRGQELGDLLGRVALMAERGGPANGSQPIRSQTNATSSAAGSRR